MDAQKISSELLKNPQFLEMFQKAMGDDKIPDEGDPARDAWLKKIQERMHEQSKSEMKQRMEAPVTDEEGQWMYISPEPGFCVKCHNVDTRGGKKEKVFINICKHERIAEPMPMSEAELEGDDSLKDSVKYRIPLSCGACRIDKDKAGATCKVYDVVVNPLTIKRCGEESEFRRFVAALCMTWIKQKSEPELNADEFTNVNIKCKGSPEMQRIRLAHPKQAGEKGNAMNDEIKLPGTKDSATVPTKAGGAGSSLPKGKMVMEVVQKPQNSHTITESSEPYDWSGHAKPTRNPWYKSTGSIPKEVTLEATLPEVQMIAEVEVSIEGRTVDFTFVDSEDNKPFYSVNLPFPVDTDPITAQFGKASKKLTLKLRVSLPNEVESENERKKANECVEEEERRLQKAKEAEQEKVRKEWREKQDRIEKEEREVMEQRKLLVENLQSLNAGQVPPELMKEINQMPAEEARALMLRVEGKVKRGDSVDKLIETLPPDVLRNLCNQIRNRLGLEPIEEPKPKQADAAKAKAAAEAESSSTTDTSYDFAKKAENMFGVKLYNRYVFALEH